MRGVVLDPHLLAAGLLGHAECRRLLVLLAFGRWSQYIALGGPAEEATLEEELRLSGGTRGGSSPGELIEAARDRRAAMANLLPLDTPDDLVLVSSRQIQAEVIKSVQQARNWRPSAAAQPDLGLEARRIVTHLTTIFVGELVATGGHQPDLGDHLVSVAAEASAPLLTEDPELAPAEYAFYQLTDAQTGRPAFSIRCWTFIDRVVNRYPFDLDQVPLGLLDISTRPL